ncbi:hypothetical protein C8R45DRAFT_920286 [Mycena sanguinolenta]|nr:hypothetical protein C8R45DRAFT_920286 [Mycena sanguinolenta]
MEAIPAVPLAFMRPLLLAFRGIAHVPGFEYVADAETVEGARTICRGWERVEGGVERAGGGDAAGASVNAAPESLTYRLRVRPIVGRLGGGCEEESERRYIRDGSACFCTGSAQTEWRLRRADSSGACLAGGFFREALLTHRD